MHAKLKPLMFNRAYTSLALEQGREKGKGMPPRDCFREEAVPPSRYREACRLSAEGWRSSPQGDPTVRTMFLFVHHVTHRTSSRSSAWIAMRQIGHSGPSAHATRRLLPQGSSPPSRYREASPALRQRRGGDPHSSEDQAEEVVDDVRRSSAPVSRSWSDRPFIDLVGL